jgi:hypothetical protein
MLAKEQRIGSVGKGVLNMSMDRVLLQGRVFREVSVAAVVSRVRRRLARDGESLGKCRTASQWYRDLGGYYSSNDRNHLVRTHIDLEQLARELEVLRPWEAIAE